MDRQPSSIHQLDEKHLQVEATLLVWSPSMDLIAVANVDNEVMLYRLSWQKVWTLKPPTEGYQIISVTWRPDGRVISLGYSQGYLSICNIDTSDKLYSVNLQGEITHSVWLSQQLTGVTPSKSGSYNTLRLTPNLHPHTQNFDASQKSINEDPIEDLYKIKSQKQLNVLLVGTTQGRLHLYVYGIFPLACINVNALENSQSLAIVSSCLSQDFGTLSLFTKNDESLNPDYQHLTYDTSFLRKWHEEIHEIALKFGYVHSLLNYLNYTIQLMCEAWEDVLIEMDSKLLKFAEDKQKSGNGSMCNDFLELLMFGTVSGELETFLLHDLLDKEKGLSKFKRVIDNYYSNIQKLLVKHLSSVNQVLLHELSEFRGLSRWKEKFSILGLQESSFEDAIQTFGTFMLKTAELQLVIDGSRRELQAFFQWLQLVITRLSGQPSRPETPKMNTFEMTSVAEFIRDNFSQDDMIRPNGGSRGFKLEKVGQYLVDEKLTHPPSSSSNLLNQFLLANPHLQENGVLYVEDRQSSLIQLHNKIKQSIHTALNHPCSVLSLLCKTVDSHVLDESSPLIIKQFDIDSTIHTVILSEDRSRFYLVKHGSSEGGNHVISSYRLTTLPCQSEDHLTRDTYHVLDISFYDNTTISLLLEAPTTAATPYLIQLPLEPILNHEFVKFKPQTLKDIPIHDVSVHVTPNACLRLDSMTASHFAVSGSRKVACVMYASRRRVRLFLLDTEDDDDDLSQTMFTVNVSPDQSIRQPDANGEDKENIG